MSRADVSGFVVNQRDTGTVAIGGIIRSVGL